MTLEDTQAIQNLTTWVNERKRRIKSMRKMHEILKQGNWKDSFEKDYIFGTRYLEDLLNDAKAEIRERK